VLVTVRFGGTGRTLTVIALALGLSTARAETPDAAPEGRIVFDKCRPCHSLAASHNGRGPTLHHLLGRRAGSVPGYPYSQAMAQSTIVWTEATLRRYLADPRRFIPGTKMPFAGLRDRPEMDALLAYLREATR
jgi:cytochrome c